MKMLGSQRLKMPFLSSIINIDSHSLRMEVFQMTKEGREVLENLDRSVNLGADVFKRRAVSLKKISLVCDIMQEFAQKLREYEVKYYRVIIACSIRETTNYDTLVNRIKTTSGIDIEVISPAEEIRLLFLLIREKISEKYDFEKINTLSFSIGSSAFLLMVSEHGKLKFCESIPLALIKSFNRHGNCKIKLHKLLDVFKSLNLQEKLHTKSSQYLLIGIGEVMKSLVNIDKKWDNSEFIELTSSKLNSILKKISKLSFLQIIEKYQINEQAAARFVCGKNIINALTDIYRCKKILFPPFSIHDALTADMIRDRSKLFEKDIIYVAESICEKYNYDPAHVENVTINSLKIFDKLKKKYDLNKRSRILLHLAARLHDIGSFIDLRQCQKHSYYLIRNSTLPGISESERLIIATVASCHRKGIQRRHPRYSILNKDEKNIINKLTSILLLGDMLDNFRFYGIDELSMRLNKNNLTVKIPHCPDELLEQFNINADSHLFSQTFGLNMKVCGDPGDYEI